MTEISEHLRPAGIRWLLVGVLSIVVIAVLIFVSSPPEPVLRTVAVVGPDHYANSANDRIDFIRNLQAAAGTSTVQEEVAEESGLTVDQIADRLKVQRVESSNLVKITYETSESDPVVAETVVLTLPEAAVRFLRTTRIEEAATRLDQARERVDAASVVVDAAELEVGVAEAELVRAIARNSNVRPDVAFDAVQDELSSLRIRRATVDAEESPVVAEQLTTAIDELEYDLRIAAIRATNFAILVTAQESAVGTYDAAATEAAEAESEVGEAEIEYGVVTSPPTVSLEVVEQETGQLWPGLRRFLSVGAAALVFVIAALGAWNIALGRKQRAREVVGSRSVSEAVSGHSKTDREMHGKDASPKPS